MKKILDVLVLSALALIWCGASKTMAEDTLAADTDSTMAALCQSYNLTFDDTPGVSPLESRGLILPVDYYQSVGIESLTCIRQGKGQETSTCRLLDTAQPVGNWDVAPCDCAPGTCRPVNHCGDPDLNSTTLGNVLIIEERSATEAVRFPPDDDSSGGTILVKFGVPTTVLSIGFMDIEETNPVVMEVRVLSLFCLRLWKRIMTGSGDNRHDSVCGAVAAATPETALLVHVSYHRGLLSHALIHSRLF